MKRGIPQQLAVICQLSTTIGLFICQILSIYVGQKIRRGAVCTADRFQSLQLLVGLCISIFVVVTHVFCLTVLPGPQALSGRALNYLIDNFCLTTDARPRTVRQRDHKESSGGLGLGLENFSLLCVIFYTTLFRIKH